MARTKQTAKKSTGGAPGMFRFTKGGKKGRKTVANPKTMSAMGNGVGGKKAIAKKTAAAAAGEARQGAPQRRRHRFRPGTVALREIRRYQKSVNHLIPEANFRRLVREILQGISSDRNRLSPDGSVDDMPMKMTRQAFEAIWEGTETYLVDFMKEANLLTLHRGGQTLGKEDMRLAAYNNGLYPNIPMGGGIITPDGDDSAIANAITTTTTASSAEDDLGTTYETLEGPEETKAVSGAVPHHHG